MKLYSWNINGIRAAEKKGFLDWMGTTKPDILCVQETKAAVDQLSDALLNGHGYHAYFHSAEHRGYSGVATFCKTKPLFVQEGLGIDRFDSEGRVLITEHESFVLYNIYFPNGQKNDERLQYKLDFYDELLPIINEQVESGLHVVVTGDWEGDGGDVMDEEFPELTFLRNWHEELEKERPLSPKEQLEHDLTVAVEAENFEEAARLRDKLRTLRPKFLTAKIERSG